MHPNIFNSQVDMDDIINESDRHMFGTIYLMKNIGGTKVAT